MKERLNFTWKENIVLELYHSQCTGHTDNKKGRPHSMKYHQAGCIVQQHNDPTQIHSNTGKHKDYVPYCVSVSLVWLRASRCIWAKRRPGNVRKAPMREHSTARNSLKVSLDTGPLFDKKKTEKQKPSHSYTVINVRYTTYYKILLKSYTNYAHWYKTTEGVKPVPCYFPGTLLIYVVLSRCWCISTAGCDWLQQSHER